jgi:nitroreductase
VLAPSNHNTQPWHFNVDGDCLTLCADRTRALPVVDPSDLELIVSCGAALFNLRVALRRCGLHCAAAGWLARSPRFSRRPT